MKTQKVLALILAAIMTLTLCACGNNNVSGSAPAPDNLPASSSEIDSSNDLTTDAEQLEDVTSFADQDTETTPDTDGQPPDETPALEPAGPEGLILMTIKTTTGAPSSMTISSVNPDTGAMQTIAGFQFGRIGDINYSTPAGSGGSPGVGYYATRSEWLSADYDKLAVSRQELTGPEVHAGWIDQDGVFFDVTAALGLGAKSDFDDPVHHEAIGFTKNNEFVYKVLIGEVGKAYETEYYYVSCDNLSANAISSGIALPGAGIDYRSSSAERISDYGESGSYLTNEQDKISLLHDASGAVSAYVPGTSRLSWNGVFSPDETSVAFMSCPKQGGIVDIYTMPLAGGDPVKVETGLALANQQECKTGYYAFGNPCIMLIDWR